MPKQTVACDKLRCFANTGRRRCKILADTSGYAQTCPFFKDYRQGDEVKQAPAETNKRKLAYFNGKEFNYFYWRENRE